MIGLLLITHGTYGESLVQNAIHVLNRRPAQLVAFGLAAQDSPIDLLPEPAACWQASMVVKAW